MINPIGERFGKLIAVEWAGRRFLKNGRKGHPLIGCRCDCGSDSIVGLYELLRGHTRSCGCLRVEISTVVNVKHGETSQQDRTPEYRAWLSMITRCTNSKHRYWKHYGGRGITICAEWRESFEAFLAHVGRKPSPKHTLDRYPNNDGNYEPGNVRWATRMEQAQNRRPRTK